MTSPLRRASPLRSVRAIANDHAIRALLEHVVEHGCRCGKPSSPDIGIVVLGRSTPLGPVVAVCQACAAGLVERHAVAEWRIDGPQDLDLLRAHYAALHITLGNLSIGYPEGTVIEPATWSVGSVTVYLYRSVAL